MVSFARFEVFLAVKIQVDIGVVVPCSVAVGYYCFRGPCQLDLQVARSFETLVSSCDTTCLHNPEDLNFKIHLIYTLRG
jgi:hypothetical protein